MASLRVSVGCDEKHEWRPVDVAPEKQYPRQHAWVEHLFEQVSVQSRSRGRIRFHLGFEGDEVLTDTLRRELHKLPSVKLASYSVRTQNALITFAVDQVNEIDVASALLRGVKEFARTHGECDLTHHHHERGKKNHNHAEDCDHDHSHQVSDAGIRQELFKLVGTGALLGYFVVKRLRATGVPAPDSPLSLASFITIASGYPIFRDGYRSVAKKGKATDDTLIGLAVSASLLMGESLTGLSVVWLIQLGRLLEMVTLKRSRTAVKELMDITPTEAWLVSSPDAGVKKVSVESLKKSQIMRVFHGEKVALDGKIVRGNASVKESFLTGEAVPRQKGIGDSVYAGSVVEAGEIDVEVTSLIHDTVVATMIDAIENLRDNKAPIEKVGAQFASKFVPISIGIAAVTFLVTRDVRRAITMLVIACPCAAGLATPTAVSATIGQLARKGILIKGGAHLETAARVDTVVFDKTGTLTLGSPVIEVFEPTEKGSQLGVDECLRLAASAEQHATHPLGRVIVNEAKTRGLVLEAVEDFKVHEGLGISGTVKGKLVRVGSRRFFKEEGIKVPESHGSLHAGESELCVSIGKSLVGSYVVRDPARPEASELLLKLRELGIKRFIMATGDQRVSADHIARLVGIDEVYAELLPTDKLELVNRLRSEGRKVAMMGDGVNDAQALAQADLSIAMGTSRCDVAIETSDVTISRDDVRLVAELFGASRKTLRAIYQNFIAAVGINAGGIAYSAMGQLSPFSAAIVHNASTLAVVLNSLRLGRAVAGGNPLKPLREVQI